MLLLASLDLSLPLRDPVAVFTVVLVVLLLAPLGARLGVPSAVVLLVAGVGLGPNALGVLDRDPTLILLGTIGLLYIMFLAGLEIDLDEFTHHRRRSLVFGGLTFALPQTVGTALGRFGFGMDWTAAVLLGSVFASHTLLAYPAAARLGLQKENAVTTAVGATILTDTLALLVLAVIAGGVSSGGPDAWRLARVVVPLVGFGAFVLWAVPRAGAWFLRRAAQDGAVEFVFVLTIVFACALGVEMLGVEPIIGAFLAGLALNRLVPESGPLMNRIGFVGNTLFVPFFLLSTGMLVDLGAFWEGGAVGRSWAVAGAMVAVVLATKGAAAWATRPLFGYRADEARLAFGLTVPQAAATLAAVLVGVELGLFDAAVLNGTIAMVAVTCLLGPWLTETAGRRLAGAAEARTDALVERPRLLVSLANPATVGPIVDLALLLREPSGPGAAEPLVAVTVVGGGTDRAADVLRGERLLSGAVVHAAGAGVPVLPLVRTEANVARALARAAAETRATTLIMGWDGSAAAERLLFGSIPDRVLRETAAAVLIARSTQPLSTVGRFVVAVPPLAELEHGFERAARLLTALAARTGARLALATSDPDPQAVVRAFTRTRRPARVPECIELDGWKQLPVALDGVLGPSDALVLLSARQGAVAWQASLDRLPRQLARRFPGRALFVLYPAQVPISAVLPARLTSGERGLLGRFGSDRIRLGLEPGPAEVLIRQTLARALLEPLRGAVLRALLAAPDARHELRPGVVLAHVHTGAAEAPIFLIGVSRTETAGRDTQVETEAARSASVVAVLAAPPRVPPPTYLGWLALVARMLGDPRTVDALRRADTPEAAHAVLLRALHPPENPDPDVTLRGGTVPVG